MGERAWSGAISLQARRGARFVGLCWLCLLATFLTLCLHSAERNILWTETFESGDFWNRWHSQGGLWAVGSPGKGPGKAFEGEACAATLLYGDYPPGMDTRLIRDRVFIVPPAAENPRLQFWHWFSGGAGASRSVEVMGVSGTWQPLTPVSGWVSDDWAQATFDLRPFSGQALRMAFHFQSTGDPNVAAGWFIDAVKVATGPLPWMVELAEDFESGLGDWTVDNDTWSTGTPTIGPAGAWDGLACAGTGAGAGMSSGYVQGADSRLISPPFTLPETGLGAQLHFQHWHDIADGDEGGIEVREAGGPWQALGPSVTGASEEWVPEVYDLSAFINKTIQVAFRFRSNDDDLAGVGWFVDQVRVERGEIIYPDVRLQVQRVSPELLSLSLEGADPKMAYVLECSEGVGSESGSSHWTELKIIEAGLPETIQLMTHSPRFFRVRTVATADQ